MYLAMSYFTPQFPSLQSPAHLMVFYTVEYEIEHVFENNELCVCHEIKLFYLRRSTYRYTHHGIWWRNKNRMREDWLSYRNRVQIKGNNGT